MIKTIKGPCQDCKDRHLHCHSECDKYKDFTEKLKYIHKKREEVRKINDAEYDGIHRRKHVYLYPKRSEK